MFCPKCGAAEQSPDSFCRSCGIFLPNIESLIKKETPVSEHLSANGVMSLMTIVASFVLAAVLYFVFFNRADTHPVIYVTAGFLIAIGCWNIQTYYRTRQLRKRLKGYGEMSDDKTSGIEARETSQLADGASSFSTEGWANSEKRTTCRLRQER